MGRILIPYKNPNHNELSGSTGPYSTAHRPTGAPHQFGLLQFHSFQSSIGNSNLERGGQVLIGSHFFNQCQFGHGKKILQPEKSPPLGLHVGGATTQFLWNGAMQGLQKMAIETQLPHWSRAIGDHPTRFPYGGLVHRVNPVDMCS